MIVKSVLQKNIEREAKLHNERMGGYKPSGVIYRNDKGLVGKERAKDILQWLEAK